MLKLQVSPHHGWGWARSEDYQFPMPSPFFLDVEVLEGGQPFHSAIGLVMASGHSLNDMWALLSQRPDNHNEYDLAIFPDRPDIPDPKSRPAEVPKFWGVALVKVVAN